MLTEQDIDLSEPPPALADWLVRCGFAPDAERATELCADLEALTRSSRCQFGFLKNAGKLIRLGLVQLGEDNLVDADPKAFHLYSACQAWLRSQTRKEAAATAA